MVTRKELTAAVAERYRTSDRANDGQVGGRDVGCTTRQNTTFSRSFQASDRICGKRLKALMPGLIAAVERHGHLAFTPELRNKRLAMSAATVDSALARVREGVGSQAPTHAAHSLRPSIPIWTSTDWNDSAPGLVEAHLVAHSGPSARGSVIQTLVLTDIATG